MVGTKSTLPTAELDNPQPNVDTQSKETGTKLQHNPMDEEITALIDDVTYKATKMKGKGDKRGQKNVFDYSDNEQQSENIGEGDNMGDENINDMDVDKLYQEDEGARELRRLSPKRIKKIES
jgi:hypothetical protein